MFTVSRAPDGKDIEIKLSAQTTDPQGVYSEMHFYGDGNAELWMDLFLSAEEARALAEKLYQTADEIELEQGQ